MMDHKRQAAAPGHKERTGPYSAADTYETGASGAWLTVVLSDMKTTTNFPCYGFIIILVYNNIVFFPLQYTKHSGDNTRFAPLGHSSFQISVSSPNKKNNPSAAK